MIPLPDGCTIQPPPGPGPPGLPRLVLGRTVCLTLSLRSRIHAQQNPPLSVQRQLRTALMTAMIPPKTTTTKIVLTCHTIYDCQVSDWDESSITSGAACLPSNVNERLARGEWDFPVPNMAAVPTTAPVSDSNSSSYDGTEEVNGGMEVGHRQNVKRARQDYLWA
ncbi:hypothetical protein BDW59DRAFT_148410 [Aspergillus cavernicola]|uniref:Uncharacterized protein n=1 Tax=Aspergillus cavernicola TaxID=176166 RepID=A0ABR4I9C4_9EURO